MKALIITIGNSKGVRIPKVLLEESGIENEVEIKANKGVIRITPAKTPPKVAGDTALMSEAALRRDWDKPEEDAAWANL
jgi:antitoxin MazE